VGPWNGVAGALVPARTGILSEWKRDAKENHALVALLGLVALPAPVHCHGHLDDMDNREHAPILPPIA
jgi:hypothetical protein